MRADRPRVAKETPDYLSIPQRRQLRPEVVVDITARRLPRPVAEQRAVVVDDGLQAAITRRASGLGSTGFPSCHRLGAKRVVSWTRAVFGKTGRGV